MGNYKIRIKNSITDTDRSIVGLIEFSKIGPKLKAIGYLDGLPNPWTNPIDGTVVSESRINYSTNEYIGISENDLCLEVTNNLELITQDTYGVTLNLEYISEEVKETIISDNLSNNFEPVPEQKSDSRPTNEFIFNVEYEGIFSNNDLGELFIIGREDKFIFDDDTISSEYLEDEFYGEEELPIKVDYDPDASVDVPALIENSEELEQTFVITQPKDGTFTISSNGMKQLIRHEGSRGTIYDDKTGKSINSYSNCVGYPTIGVGHRITNSEKATFAKFLSPGKMSSNAIENLLLKDLQVRINNLNRSLKVKVTQNQFDALLSMMFNCGSGNSFYKRALSQTNKGDFKGAAATIKSGPNTSKGVRINSLAARRNDESNIYLA